MPGSMDPATRVLYDDQVRTAWTRRALSDGTKLDVGSVDKEQFFAVTPTGTFGVVATRSGWRKCNDRDHTEARVTVTNLSAIVPNAGGHTHPLGRNRDIVPGLPGPEDGAMARKTGKPAYVISRGRAFAIEESSPDTFTVRVVAGDKFSRSEQRQIQAIVATWNKYGGGSGANGGGSGVTCEFIPD